MSSYPITGCGLPSKPRANEPTMFQILSWAGDNDLSKSIVEENKLIDGQDHYQPNFEQVTTQPPKPQSCKHPSNQQNSPQILHQQQQIYQEHHSPNNNHKLTLTKSKHSQIPQIVVAQNDPKVFQKSHLFKKVIKPQLNSYQPINLKASRAKSAINMPKTDHQEKFNPKNHQQAELDEKTIKERKQKIKEFEVFTRILPNSAFTTYYGKPAFENYGRGTSYQNLKSFNVMPHKGDNHPKNVESHYTALIKARNVKSKSYMPRKPLEENLPPHQDENQQLTVPQLPIQKPDLIKSMRFATITPLTAKKAGPPQTSTRNITSTKKPSHKATNTRQQKSKSFAHTKLGDGLKYLNKRQNLIDILQEQKLKASKLAYKVTECYPLKVQDLNNEDKEIDLKENRQEIRPAGKASKKEEALRDLIQSRFVLQQNIHKV